MEKRVWDCLFVKRLPKDAKMEYYLREREQTDEIASRWGMSMKITEDFIAHFTGNASTASNGKKLASGGSFQALHKNKDETLLFGSCKGSGKNPYQCSVDFIEPEKPVPRCSCPSRQIPCKHVAGLLYCYLQGKPFTEEELPGDIADKREKSKRREEKKAERAEQGEDGEKTAEPQKMTKARANAAVKKCRAQLEGIDLAEKILHNIVLSGLHSIDGKTQKLYMDQAKELGNYYVGGIQAGIVDLLQEAFVAQKEQRFSEAVGQCGYLFALLKKSRAHTENKIADYEAFPDMTDTAREATIHSSVEEQMGYAWKLSELKEHGLYLENAELLQLGFSVIDEPAKKQFVDEGIWLCLTNGEIYLTKNFRPYRAQKYIRSEDSFFPLLTTPELFIYPGDKNPRVRWERSEQRDVLSADLQKAAGFGERDYAGVLKAVKSQIKNPLADKTPIFALRVKRLGLDEGGAFHVFDEAGTSIPLRLEQFGFLLHRLNREQAEDAVLVCRFGQDIRENKLYAVLVAMLTGDSVIRFAY